MTVRSISCFTFYFLTLFLQGKYSDYKVSFKGNIKGTKGLRSCDPAEQVPMPTFSVTIESISFSSGEKGCL